MGEMFESNFAETCAEKYPIMSMGACEEGLACADPVARTPIGVSGNGQLLCMLGSKSVSNDYQILNEI